MKDQYKSAAERFRRRIRRIGNGAAGLIYPPDIYCICCDRPIDPGQLYSMCSRCLSEIEWANHRTCRLCGKVLEDWYPIDLCNECNGNRRGFDAGITCFIYQGGVRSMLTSMKYRGQRNNARVCGEILADRIRYAGIEEEFDWILPVPMHAKKMRIRGYDQAELVARYTAKELRKDCVEGALVRIRPTEPMSSLTGRQRRKNLHDAFAVTEWGRRVLAGSSVLLVDDIMTTGTTAEACSEVLKEAGVKTVIAASMASGRNQRILPDRPEKPAGK